MVKTIGNPHFLLQPNGNYASLEIKDVMPIKKTSTKNSSGAFSRTVSAPGSLWEKALIKQKTEDFSTMSDYIQHLLRVDTKGIDLKSHAL